MTCSEMAAAARPLRVGDVVEVRSPEEILVTLDERGGETENLPFMPEMLQFCGRQLTVHKVAHKLCDTINRSGIHRMENAVHLTGARCDGSSHGAVKPPARSIGRRPGSNVSNPERPDRRPTAASLFRCWRSTLARIRVRTVRSGIPARQPN